MTTEQPFIRHIPIAIVMSISRMGFRAGMRRTGDSRTPPIERKVLGLPLSGTERETDSPECRAAPGTAMTSNGAILLSGHKVER